MTETAVETETPTPTATSPESVGGVGETPTATASIESTVAGVQTGPTETAVAVAGANLAATGVGSSLKSGGLGALYGLVVLALTLGGLGLWLRRRPARAVIRR